MPEELTTIEDALEQYPDRTWDDYLTALKSHLKRVKRWSERTQRQKDVKAAEREKLERLMTEGSRYQQIQKREKAKQEAQKKTAWQVISDTAHNNRALLQVAVPGKRGRSRSPGDDHGARYQESKPEQPCDEESESGSEAWSQEESDDELISTAEQQTYKPIPVAMPSTHALSAAERRLDDVPLTGLREAGVTVEDLLAEHQGHQHETAADSWILHMDDPISRAWLPQLAKKPLQNLWRRRSMARKVIACAKPGADTSELSKDFQSAFAYLNELETLAAGEIMNAHEMYDHEIRLPLLRGDEKSYTHRRTAIVREMVVTQLRQLTSGSTHH
ncbi:hypothetical protein HDU87_004877 [Geranomyces variabilis]|uniref:Uncharacterized protein n=1 Tax=Geranomyces variabilis TaxID=109894 RepID=A0AAD5TN34_9FUNG|nr:hypothetical protein HDU87_004877 [Geranomyces variabilis]